MCQRRTTLCWERCATKSFCRLCEAGRHRVSLVENHENSSFWCQVAKRRWKNIVWASWSYFTPLDLPNCNSDVGFCVLILFAGLNIFCVCWAYVRYYPLPVSQRGCGEMPSVQRRRLCLRAARITCRALGRSRAIFCAYWEDELTSMTFVSNRKAVELSLFRGVWGCPKQSCGPCEARLLKTGFLAFIGNAVVHDWHFVAISTSLRPSRHCAWFMVPGSQNTRSRICWISMLLCLFRFVFCPLCFAFDDQDVQGLRDTPMVPKAHFHVTRCPLLAWFTEDWRFSVLNVGVLVRAGLEIETKMQIKI